tara:strand:+ start:55 stop:213 length:159 start_codon:yes stop_codon:yes gene_type:complete
MGKNKSCFDKIADSGGGSAKPKPAPKPKSKPKSATSPRGGAKPQGQKTITGR